MNWTWNKPPGWPEPPEDWSPSEGWQPDPSWPPAPDDWEFWTPMPSARSGEAGAAGVVGAASSSGLRFAKTLTGVGAGTAGLLLGLVMGASGPDVEAIEAEAQDAAAVRLSESEAAAKQELSALRKALEAEKEAAVDEAVDAAVGEAVEQEKKMQKKRISKAVDAAVAEAESQMAESQPRTLTESGGTDPRFGTCGEANAAGYGNYRRGSDPEYDWYQDRDGDGVVCE